MSNDLPNQDILEPLIASRESRELQNVWFASTFSLSRNFANFKFKEQLSKDQRFAITQLAMDTCAKNDNIIKNPTLITNKDLGAWQKEVFLEHFLFNQNQFQPHIDATAFIKDDSLSFFIALNLNDHVVFHIVDFGQDLENTWTRLNQIDVNFHKQVGFAFSNDFGFLTTNPKNCGTGLRISAFLHLPLLFELNKFSDLIDEKIELSFTNFDGEAGNPIDDPTHFLGNIIMITNSCSLGLTEENIISSLRIWCTKAMYTELGLRKTLALQENKILKDKVMRALGLITHSYQLEPVETLNALSLIKLGLDLQWLTGLKNTSIITQMFWNIRRAYLMVKHAGQENSTLNDIPKIRSKYLKDICGKITVSE